MTFRFIEAEKASFPISRMCRALEVSQSGFFAWRDRGALRPAIRRLLRLDGRPGLTASTDPEAWKIVDGKLYVNYDKGVQAKWEADIPGYIRAADGNWPKVLE